MLPGDSDTPINGGKPLIWNTFIQELEEHPLRLVDVGNELGDGLRPNFKAHGGLKTEPGRQKRDDLRARAL